MTGSTSLPGADRAAQVAPDPITGAFGAASTAEGAGRREHAGEATLLAKVSARARLGLKGPLAADWLAVQGIDVPAAPNRWTFGVLAAINANETRTSAADVNSAPESASAPDEADENILVARLGSSEFFIEDVPTGAVVARLSLALRARPAGVYPVLREDTAFLLTGPGADAVLAQVCNVDFAAVSLESHMLIMTLMIGVAVLVVPQAVAGERGYRIWCDPSFGPYLGDTLGAVVLESGGLFKGVSI